MNANTPIAPKGEATAATIDGTIVPPAAAAVVTVVAAVAPVTDPTAVAPAVAASASTAAGPTAFKREPRRATWTNSGTRPRAADLVVSNDEHEGLPLHKFFINAEPRWFANVDTC